MDTKYVVVDAQFHYLPWEACKKSEQKAHKARIKDPALNMAYHRLYNLEAAISHMQECGVDMVLAGLANWILAGLEVCKVINDGLAKLVKEHPGKFIPLAHVPYFETKGAIDELDRAINDLGLKGVTVMTSHRGIRLDDKHGYMGSVFFIFSERKLWLHLL